MLSLRDERITPYLFLMLCEHAHVYVCVCVRVWSPPSGPEEEIFLGGLKFVGGKLILNATMIVLPYYLPNIWNA